MDDEHNEIENIKTPLVYILFLCSVYFGMILCFERSSLLCAENLFGPLNFPFRVAAYIVSPLTPGGNLKFYEHRFKSIFLATQLPFVRTRFQL